MSWKLFWSPFLILLLICPYRHTFKITVCIILKWNHWFYLWFNAILTQLLTLIMVTNIYNLFAVMKRMPFRVMQIKELGIPFQRDEIELLGYIWYLCVSCHNILSTIFLRLREDAIKKNDFRFNFYVVSSSNKHGKVLKTFYWYRCLEHYYIIYIINIFFQKVDTLLLYVTDEETLNQGFRFLNRLRHIVWKNIFFWTIFTSL